jgi:hypothetical protein
MKQDLKPAANMPPLTGLGILCGNVATNMSRLTALKHGPHLNIRASTFFRHASFVIRH